MFSSDWNASYRLEHFINGLLWFLQNPNPDSALNSACSIRNPKEYEEAVHMAITGLPVKGKVYDKIVRLETPQSILASTCSRSSSLCAPCSTRTRARCPPSAAGSRP